MSVETVERARASVEQELLAAEAEVETRAQGALPAPPGGEQGPLTLRYEGERGGEPQAHDAADACRKRRRQTGGLEGKVARIGADGAALVILMTVTGTGAPTRMAARCSCCAPTHPGGT